MAIFYLRRIQPMIGTSNDPVPGIPEWIDDRVMPFLSFVFFTIIYFSFAGWVHVCFYMPFGNDYIRKHKVQKAKTFIWSEHTRQLAGASERDLKMFWKGISSSFKAIFAVAWLACYQLAILRGKTNIYWSVDRKGAMETFFWLAVAYVSIDTAQYWVHRVLHWPWMYKHVHKAHHMWKSPNPYSTLALVPLEFLFLSIATMTLLSMIPLWFPLYIWLVLYTLFMNVVDHGGVEMTHPFFRFFFWQVPVNFHDRHHEHFHVNYAPLVDWWDKLYGSYYYEGVTKVDEETFQDHWANAPTAVRSVSRRFTSSDSMQALRPVKRAKVH
jgi:sterol desaturase/sphingolipid hydroxylase (fatty acid hydroxylase superfamily)